MTSEKFEETKFMKELVNLKDTQDAVQCLSGWCIRNRKFSYKIARCWLKCAKKGKNYFSFYLSMAARSQIIKCFFYQPLLVSQRKQF
jgi:hypothetical protein